MPRRYYVLAVIGCALSWLVVGLHLPALLEMTHEGNSPQWLVVTITVAFCVMGVGDMWILLRAPAPWQRPVDPPPSST